MRRAAVLVKIMEKASGPALVGVGALFSSPAVELIAKSETPHFIFFIFFIFKASRKLLAARRSSKTSRNSAVPVNCVWGNPN